MKRRRRQHDLETWTEPTRTQAANTALHGTPNGYPVEVLEDIARALVDELRNGEKDVYARLGRRWDVKWPTAGSRVLAAVRKGVLIWTGSDHNPNGYLPAEGPGDPPPGSFEERIGLLQRWLEEHDSLHVPRGTVYRGAKLRSWMDSQRQRYQAGTLTKDQIDALDAIPRLVVASPGRSGRPDR